MRCLPLLARWMFALIVIIAVASPAAARPNVHAFRQPQAIDSDGDGLGDDREIANGTDPFTADTDADGVGDGSEVANGTDPLVPDQPEEGDDGKAGDGSDDGMSNYEICLLYTSPSPRDRTRSRMPSSA